MIIHRFSWCDILIIISLLCGIFLTFPALRTLSPGTVQIFKDNQIIAEYPINQNRVFDVQGKKGIMEVRIQDNMVSVISSTCPHQICARQGKISKPYNQIVCIPNHVLITISTKKDEMLDAVSR
ncbi:MAG TPA: NusG domain II-containing protein [Chitinispirillaceae bacterium]|nr:NusG domain II-containing protein [Chitinispirillaceae bacterium]